MLTRYFPKCDVAASPWPRVMLSNGAAFWVGMVGQSLYLRLSSVDPLDDVPGIALGNGDKLVKLFSGRGSRNRLRVFCVRGHVLPSKRNSAGRRQCWACVALLRRAVVRTSAAHGCSDPRQHRPAQ